MRSPFPSGSAALAPFIFTHAALTMAALAETPPPLPEQLEEVAAIMASRPIYSGTIKSDAPGGNLTMKAVIVTVGGEEMAYVCYDTDLLRMSVAWSGGFLDVGNAQLKIEHPKPAKVSGAFLAGTKPGPGWARAGSFTDPRAKKQGPLPRDWAKYRGLYLYGRRAILSYTVGSASLVESPDVEFREGAPLISRTFEIGPTKEPLTLLVAEQEGGSGAVIAAGSALGTEKTGPAAGKFASLTAKKDGEAIVAAVVGSPEGAQWEVTDSRIHLKLPALPKGANFKLLLRRVPTADLAAAAGLLKPARGPERLAPLCKGGPANWPQPVVTKGVLGADTDAYTVDVITEPVPNPWSARTFFGGFDFLPDGRAVIAGFYGDVWLVSGIDAKLEKVTWKRFASGLFQPLGVKVVGRQIYVLGRDQITRLTDYNGDGEADFYENFNNDTVVTDNYHEFCFDLQADRAGNFYYAKSSPYPPNVTSPSQGILFKVSADGAKLETIATGLRTPNGLGMGPNDEITVSDNQGNWIPASKLNWIKPGGFYGMMPAAHRDPPPTDFDPPLCWLPMSVDSSSGGQVWVTSDRWGPLKNHLIFTSYGKGTLFKVMHEEVEGVRQGGMVQFPLKFPTGVMRARFHAGDGQLYLCGLRGWQTSGVKDGGFYRVRYTGKAVPMPVELHVVAGGLKITFATPFDTAKAADPGNYGIEQWNYVWSSGYGSGEKSVLDPTKGAHDPVEISAVELSPDGKTVLLKIPALQPVMQMKIKYNIATAAGAELKQEIYNTIHRVPAK